MKLHWSYASRLGLAAFAALAFPLVANVWASMLFLGLTLNDAVEASMPAIVCFAVLPLALFVVGLMTGDQRKAAPKQKTSWIAFLPTILLPLIITVMIAGGSPGRFVLIAAGYALGISVVYVVFFRWVQQQRRSA